MRLHDFLNPQVAAVAFDMKGAGAGSVKIERQAESISISSGKGSAAVLPAASQTEAGVLGIADKTKLDAMSDKAARISSRSELAATHVSASVLSMQTDGFAAPGDGGAALYVRRPDEPPHEGKVRSADGDWWELAPKGQVRATQFGAVEDADVTAAVQNAVNFAAYGATATPGMRKAAPCEVLIDIQAGTLSDTIQLGYGFDYQTLLLRGLGNPYTDADDHPATCMTFTATDRPAFAINAGRDSRLANMTIIGVAGDDMLAMGISGLAPTLAATWDAALTANGVTPGRRYAPYAAIAIDPYVGTAPATAYPDVSCPDWISGGSFTQYGKKRSHATVIENVTIRGFEVGIAQTPADEDNNGDFPVMRHCRFDSSKWGFSTSNNQGRIPTFYYCQFGRLWTAYTNKIHGRQNGTSNGLFIGCGFGAFIGNLFSLNSSAYAGMTFQSCDMEGIHRIGDVGSGATTRVPIWFRNCALNFRHSDVNGHPSNVFSGDGGIGLIGFDGGDVRVSSVGTFTNCRVQVINGTMISHGDLTGSRAKAYGQTASNALAGGIVLDPYYVTPEFDCAFQGYNLNTEAADNTYLVGPHSRGTTREKTVPLWSPEVQRGRTNGAQQRREGLRRPLLMDRRNRAGYSTPPSRSGRVISFNAGWLATNEQSAVQMGYRRGGVLFDKATGTTAFIRFVDHSTGAVEAELQNNYIGDGSGGYDLLDTSFDPASGIWCVLGTGVYLAPQTIRGTTDATTAVITVAAALSAPEADYGLAVGDWLFEDLWPVEQTFSTPGRARIAAIAAGGATTGGTITMNGNAEVTHTAALSFDWWVRAEPENEPER